MANFDHILAVFLPNFHLSMGYSFILWQISSRYTQKPTFVPLQGTEIDFLTRFWSKNARKWVLSTYCAISQNHGKHTLRSQEWPRNLKFGPQMPFRNIFEATEGFFEILIFYPFFGRCRLKNSNFEHFFTCSALKNGEKSKF